MSSIYIKRKGTGGAVWYIKYREDGRWVYKSLKTSSRKIAEEKQARIDVKVGSRIASKVSEIVTFEDLWTAFEPWAKLHLRPQTIESRKRAIVTWQRVTGVKRLSGVSPASIQDFKERRIKGGVAPRTVNEALGALKAAINRMRSEGLYDDVNPFEKVAFLTEEKKLPRWLTKEEIARFMEVAESHSEKGHLFCAAALYAGLRKGEALNIQGVWFDLESDIIHLQSSQWFVLKTHEERAFRLHSELRTVLDKYWDGQYQGFLIEPEILASPKGWRYRTEIRKTFTAIAEAAEVPWATPHTLRHTFASQLAQAGVSLYKIASYMGHTSVNTTQRYAHLGIDDDINRF